MRTWWSKRNCFQKHCPFSLPGLICLRHHGFSALIFQLYCAGLLTYRGFYTQNGIHYTLHLQLDPKFIPVFLENAYRHTICFVFLPERSRISLDVMILSVFRLALRLVTGRFSWYPQNSGLFQGSHGVPSTFLKVSNIWYVYMFVSRTSLPPRAEGMHKAFRESSGRLQVDRLL